MSMQKSFLNLLKERYWISSFLFSLFGFFLVFFITQTYGSGVSGDSVDYIATADHLLKGLGFLDYAGEPYLYWPPLYPLLLAGLSRLTNSDPVAVARFLNAACFSLIVFLSGVLFRRSFRQQLAWAYFGSLVVLTSLPLLSLAANITTDPLFIVFVLSYGWLGSMYLSKPSWAMLLAISFVISLAAILRWHGVILVASASILILIANRKNFQIALLKTFLVGLIGSIPFALWVVGRNYRLLGTFMGRRDTANINFWHNLNDSARKITHWFLPDQIIRHIPPFVILGFLLILLFILNNRDNWRHFARRLTSQLHIPWLIFVPIYYLFVLSTSVTYDHPGYLDDRYYAPLFVFVFLLGVLIINDLVVKPIGSTLSTWQFDLAWAKIILLCLAFLWSIYPSYRLYKYVVVSREQGVSTYNTYNTRNFHQSLVVQYLNRNPLGQNEPVYSNNASAAYYFRRDTTLRSPNSAKYRSDLDYLQTHFQDWPSNGQAYLIWFLPHYWGHYYPPRLLKTVADLEPIFSSSDGVIYLVQSR